jgi:DNA-binding MarR family transcriptional regulator
MSKLKDEIKKRRPFESLEQEVLLNLLRTAERLTRDFDDLMKSSELSRTQYNVLRILRGASAEDPEGLACGEIAERMITRDPDMTRLLDRLEKRGLIARSRPSSDRRVVKARVTPEGLDAIAKLDEPLRAAHKRQLAHMSEHDLQTLSRLLEQARAKSTQSP